MNTTGYSPTAAAIAQSNASAQNAEMISDVIERGQANLATLEHAVIKDNTVMPGEWYGGQLHIQPVSYTHLDVYKRQSWYLPCRDLRWPLFLGHRFRGTSDLRLCLFRLRVPCGLLTRRLGAGLAAFRAFLSRRNALLCFGHGCLL